VQGKAALKRTQAWVKRFRDGRASVNIDPRCGQQSLRQMTKTLNVVSVTLSCLRFAKDKSPVKVQPKIVYIILSEEMYDVYTNRRCMFLLVWRM
jgi:hypothetical protein